MENTSRRPSLAHVLRWFDFRGRKLGTFAFILNRITAVGLTIYLFIHLIVLGRLAAGPEAFDSFLELVESPIYIFLELLVVAAGLIHGLNGLRVIANSFGYGVSIQRQLFAGLMIIAIIATFIFAIRMFTV